MEMSNLGLIIQREYMERVRKKSFLITTILMPVLMIILMGAPALIMMYNTPEHNVIGVVDKSGIVLPHLESNELYDFIPLEGEKTAQGEVDNGKINGFLIIPEDIGSSPSPVLNLYMEGAIPIELQSSLSSQINNTIETQKLLSYNIQNLPEIMENVKTDVKINEIRLDKEEGESLESSLSFIIGIFMSFLLYMFILMYGQMVMTSIIEEKNNRVLELVVSSVTPNQLMLGKITGIGLVAVTQIVIWGAIMSFISTLALPAFLPEEAMTQITQMRAGSLDMSQIDDYSTLSALNVLTNVGFIIQLFFWLILFLVGGFLLYAAMFAAVGSAVDNIQDASQLQSFILIPIIIAIIVSTSIGNAPNSTLAVWLSMIPFTSPMVMMSRIPAGIDAWQPWVSVVILYASFIFMVWFAGKVYRIGIFMYGKKPNVKDLIKWARYK
ncbi:MAG: ABC transporter permease [Muribaculaceae bacterium]|nr:ABC transporter permease [Muribaculaceae bacterium]